MFEDMMDVLESKPKYRRVCSVLKRMLADGAKGKRSFIESQRKERKKKKTKKRKSTGKGKEDEEKTVKVEPLAIWDDEETTMVKDLAKLGIAAKKAHDTVVETVAKLGVELEEDKSLILEKQKTN